jgi:hypothetical protein
MTGSAMDYRLSEAAPVPVNTVSSSLGYSYRDNPINGNLDRMEIVVVPHAFNANGYWESDPDSDGELPTTSYLYYTKQTFWPNVFPRWVELAQMRDGYNPTATSLNDTTWRTVKDYADLVVTTKIKIRTLWALFHATARNQGMHTMRSALSGKRSRMQNLLKWSNTLVYPQEWDEYINYWSQIYEIYPGGAIIVPWFCFELINKDTPTSGAFHDWNTSLPDFTSSTQVGYELTDIELALTLLDGYNMSTANWKTDHLNMLYHMNMLGLTAPQTPAPGLIVDPKRFWDQFCGGGFWFKDSVNGLIGYPQVDSEQSLIYCRSLGSWDELDWKGMKRSYAFMLEGTDVYASVDDSWLFSLGTTMQRVSDSNYPITNVSIYTKKDGWHQSGGDLDMSAAAGLQAFVWAHPHVTIHPDSFMAIAAEEVEKLYHRGFDEPGLSRWYMPVDHFGEKYVRWLHEIYKVPWIA